MLHMPKDTGYSISGYHPPSKANFNLIYDLPDVSAYLKEIKATLSEKDGDHLLLMQEGKDLTLSAILMKNASGQHPTFAAIRLEIDTAPVPQHIYEWDSVRLTSTEPSPKLGEDSVLIMRGLESPQHLLSLLNDYELILAGNFIGPLKPLFTRALFCRNFNVKDGDFIVFETHEKIRPIVHFFRMHLARDGITWCIHPARFVPE